MIRLMTFVLVLASTVALAQPAPPASPPTQNAGTEDRDVPGTEILPWYLPPPRDETPMPLMHRRVHTVLATLGRQSISGDLSGSISEIVVTYGNRDLELGATLASADLHLTDQPSPGVMRTANNDATAFLATFGVGRNWGVDIYDEGEVHVHLLVPSFRIQFGAASPQDVNDTLPVTMGDAQTVGMFGFSLAVTGLRLSTCSGWMVDLRAPVFGGWAAVRTFDPSMPTTMKGADIAATGSSWGAELEVGHAFWQ